MSAEEIFITAIVIVFAIFLVFLFSRRSKRPVLPNPTPTPVNNRPNGESDTSSTQAFQVPTFQVVCVQTGEGTSVQVGQRFGFPRPWITFGRGDEQDVVIKGNLVSRRHAALIAERDDLVLQDLDSTNGTWVNGRRIIKDRINLGDLFLIGSCQFTVVPIGEHPQITLPKPLTSQAPPPTTYIPNGVPELVVQKTGFTILRELGDGGAATVYLAQNHYGQQVALKILHDTADPYFQQKFKDEIEAGKRLQHKHIVRVLSIGTVQGHSYIIMEFLDGGTLRDYLNHKKVLTESDAINIIGQISDGLGYAHKRQIYHRDIKPENILFNQAGVFKIGDFGIAKLTQASVVTREGMIIGTPHYMSYEQARARPVNERSDQYALAIILFEMLTGRPPFDGEGLTVVEHHIGTLPPPPRSLNPNISYSVEKVILRALEKDQNKRFPDMYEFAKALGYQATKHTSKQYKDGNILPGRLIASSQAPTQAIIRLEAPSTTIGRLNLQVDLPQISRQHARIHFKNGNYIMEDLNSANGTYVNGQQLTSPVQLNHNDKIRIGPVEFTFRLD